MLVPFMAPFDLSSPTAGMPSPSLLHFAGSAELLSFMLSAGSVGLRVNHCRVARSWFAGCARQIGPRVRRGSPGEVDLSRLASAAGESVVHVGGLPLPMVLSGGRWHTIDSRTVADDGRWSLSPDEEEVNALTEK